MNSKMVVPNIQFFIDRRELISKMKEVLDVDAAAVVEERVPFIQTTIICGPRECGKSTLIKESTQEHSAVVKIFMKGKALRTLLSLLFGLGV